MEMEKEVKILNLDDILPNRFQPRIQFNESAILELADSIKEHGVIQPIVVRKISDKYEIIAGERRYKASLLAGKKTIPAIITNLDDKNSAEIALIENVQRQDLTPIEEAISYKKILDMGYLNQTELAEKLGKTQSTIANKLRLLNLSEKVQEALLEQKISERHARSLLKLKENQQPSMLDRIINERLTVRKTDEEINKILENNSSDESQKIIESPFVSEEESIANQSVEILDLNLEGNEVEKMNQELNIPMEKIVEPVEDVTSTNNAWTIPETPIDPAPTSIPQVSDIPAINENSIAPGFMDVNKIENEAQDIFKPTTEPADMEMLLQSTPQPTVQSVESPMAPINPISESSPINQEPVGKFFGMLGGVSEMKPTEDLEKQQTNMDFGETKVNNTFMFNFNPLGSSTSEVEQKTDIFTQSTTPSTTMTTDTPVVNTTPDATSIFGVPSIPVVENNSSNFTNLSDMSPVIEPQPTVETTEVIQPTPVVEPQVVVDTPVVNIQPTVEPTSDIDIFNGLNNIEQTNLVTNQQTTVENNIFTPNETISQSNVFTPNIEEQPLAVENTFEPFNPYSLNENNEFTQDNELDNYKLGESSIAAVSAPVVPIVETPSQPVAMDLKNAISTVRECAKQLEALGYNIELDELDLTEHYQVTFKINK